MNPNETTTLHGSLVTSSDHHNPEWIDAKGSSEITFPDQEFPVRLNNRIYNTTTIDLSSSSPEISIKEVETDLVGVVGNL
jgi:hypothetical protein